MIFRNSEHYSDPTAGKAIANVMGESRDQGFGNQHSGKPYSRRTNGESDRLDRENWEELGIAIIVTAAEEYRKCRALLQPKSGRLRIPPQGQEIIRQKMWEIEVFFLSEWFCKLTTADGEMILERLKSEEAEDDCKGISGTSISA